MDRLTGKLY